jgi:hypothetical protein
LAIGDPHFTDALADRFHVARITQRQPVNPDLDSRPRLPILQACKPPRKLTRLADLDHEFLCIL